MARAQDSNPKDRSDKASARLFFRVSSGLKRIIGRDLIVNEFVAIFELVKNSFDAHARKVDLIFVDDRLFIVDDGKGMAREDIDSKWLFVAYSAKRDDSEDRGPGGAYRERIGGAKAYAGSKGVGRFSCDRLGKKLRLQSKTAERGSVVEVVEVDWDRFEQDDKQEFVRIPVAHSNAEKLSLPAGFKAPKHGTILEIYDLRQGWDRDKLLSLKAALSKLINPFGALTDSFVVAIHAPAEVAADLKDTGSKTLRELAAVEDEGYHRVVNGPVSNFIFDTLRGKTTLVDVSVSDDGEHIVSQLTDRGELIYRIREPNPYRRLADSGLKCQLFYLNQSAKQTFARRMGVASVQFGSVFLFRNGFRVFPVGEEGDDSFGLDRRKQQGYNRFLGTRELIGRIDVTGQDEDFKEATSRDQGLIRTAAYLELEEFFREKCLKRLERYVVDISWKDAADKDFDDISRMLGDKASARITDLVARLADAEGIELLEYSPNLVRIIDEKSEDYETALNSLRLVAERTGNQDLQREIDRAAERYQALKQAEADARAEVEREREARTQAEARASDAARAQKRAEDAYEDEKKRSLFLTSMATVDTEIVVNLHHQIVIYAAEMHHTITNQLDKLRHKEPISPEELLSVFEHLAFKNQQVLAVSRFVTRANFRLDSEQIQEDIASFITQYLQEVCPLYSADRMTITVNPDAPSLVRQFKPIEVSMLIDNLVSNSRKAGATKVAFDLKRPKPSELVVTVTDNGAGLDSRITEPQRIFEKGFTTTKGSGLGLYYVRFILDQMRGSIEVDPAYSGGARFVMRIFK